MGFGPDYNHTVMTNRHHANNGRTTSTSSFSFRSMYTKELSTFDKQHITTATQTFAFASSGNDTADGLQSSSKLVLYQYNTTYFSQLMRRLTYFLESCQVCDDSKQSKSSITMLQVCQSCEQRTQLLLHGFDFLYNKYPTIYKKTISTYPLQQLALQHIHLLHHQRYTIPIPSSTPSMS